MDKAENNKKQKILYGAGYFGQRALNYYGYDNVHAFADKNKTGEYCNKPVLSPEALPDLQKTYDIVICINDYFLVSQFLTKIGVYRFFAYHEIDVIYDITKIVPDRDQFNENTRSELSKIDFISNPEAVNDCRYIIDAARTIPLPKETAFNIWIGENLLYGHFENTRRYAGKDDDFLYYEAPAILHGYLVIKAPFNLKWYSIISPGVLYKKYIHQSVKDCLFFSIGPYFTYVEPYYTNQKYTYEKEKLGKNLTVFTVHTIPQSTAEYDYDDFIDIVMKDAKNFDTLTVCVHYNDYDSDIVDFFRAKGARIVVAGLFTDPMFVSRLKTIIQLSDAVITNAIGSHVFHAISINKPVKLVPQKIKYVNSVLNINSHYEKYYDLEQPHNKILLQNEYRISSELITAYEPIIGFRHTKTKQEMADIFDLSKRIIADCEYKPSNYINSIRKTYRELQNSTNQDEKRQLKLMKEALPDDYDDYLKKIGE